jgi:hypothetical protein
LGFFSRELVLRERPLGALPEGDAGDQYRVFSKSKKTGNVLSMTESQGFRKQMGFGPELN